MPRVVIDRTRWLRGQPMDGTLYRSGQPGKMCCLGFACYQLSEGRLTKEDMEEIGLPWELASWSYARLGEEETVDQLAERLNLPEWLVSDEPIVDDLARVNDHEGLSGAEREAEIIRMFASQGVEVKFVG